MKTLNINYYYGLDGIRGIAALLVVLYHFFHKIIPFGWIGVDMFFALSGFLITNLIIQNSNKLGFIKNFYFRRFLRIMPLYYLVVVPILILLLILNQTNLSQALSYLLYFQNFFEVNNLKYIGPLGHTWSLAIEEQFYLFYPFIFVLFKKFKGRLNILILLTIISILSRFYFFELNLSYYYQSTLIISRMDSLIIGGILPLIVNNRNISKINLNKILNSIIIFSITSIIILILFTGNFNLIKGLTDFENNNLLTHNYGHVKFTLMALFFSSIIGKIAYKTSRKSELIIKLLEINFIKYIGKISYGIYIYHWVILVIYRKYLEFFDIKLNELLNSLILIMLILLTINISHLSFKYFEKPILKYKHLFEY